jgi:hypothetical protein
MATVRWLLRVERLLALASWRLEDYQRAAVWVGLRLPAGSVPPGRERQQQTGVPGGGRRGGPEVG